MCGRLNVTDSPELQSLCEQLDIEYWPSEGIQYDRCVRAAQRVTIVLESQGRRVARNAIWWLLLEPSDDGGKTQFKPSKYTSFNTRYDKLNQRQSAGYHAYRHQRCIVPVVGFGETQKVNGTMRYYDFSSSTDSGIALGGLYREWRGTGNDGEPFIETSFSIVTLPPHPKLEGFHNKASPLMLAQSDGSLAHWLDTSVTTSEQLDWLLAPKVRQPLRAQPINKPTQYLPIGDPHDIAADPV